MRTRPAGMRSSGSPGSWPPSAAEFRCVSLTLYPHPKTSKLFPEFDGMFMAANRAFLTSCAPARVRIGAPSARAEASCPRPFPPGLLQPPRDSADPRRHPPLPPGRLDLLADRRACSASRVTGSCGVGAFSARVRHCASGPHRLACPASGESSALPGSRDGR